RAATLGLALRALHTESLIRQGGQRGRRDEGMGDAVLVEDRGEFVAEPGTVRRYDEGGAGGADDKSGASSAAKGNVDATGEEAGAGGRPAHPERELACSRLVVEGTVARVEPDEDAPGSRVTLTVVRSYRPAHGPAEVRFLLGADARPAPRAGQHVLVRVGPGERYASLWAVGDRRVAAERAWITEALPGSRTLACSSAGGS
ncbi:hypothetical protein ACWDE9_13315, partial [Streptomyces olivaceoviridis]